MDINLFVVWATAALSVIAILGHAKTFFGSAATVAAAKVEKHETKLTDHDRRIQKLENDLVHLPDRDTTHRLEVSMERLIGRLDKQESAMDGRFNAMDERLRPIQAIGERLNDALIEAVTNKAA